MLTLRCSQDMSDGNITRYLHDFGKLKVVFAMAASAEYGPQLRQRINPVMLGVGPVESAINFSEFLCELRHYDVLPSGVVLLGSAGSRTLIQCEVYQVSSVSYRDMDASALGFEKGCTPYLDLPPIMTLPCLFPDLPGVHLSTGASVVSGNAYDGLVADMVDMETFSVLRVCQKFNVPLYVLRGVSDGSRELSQLSDWTAYLHIIDAKLASLVDRLRIDCEEGRVPPGSCLAV